MRNIFIQNLSSVNIVSNLTLFSLCLKMKDQEHATLNPNKNSKRKRSASQSEEELPTKVQKTEQGKRLSRNNKIGDDDSLLVSLYSLNI